MKRLRDASAVILAARSNFRNHVPKAKRGDSDYVVLTARRSAKSSFLPDEYVFPGGVLEQEHDCSQQWRDLFHNLNFHNVALNSSIIAEAFPGKLKVFQSLSGEALPRTVSLRIAAIRETFEECGILLCRGQHLDRETKYGNNLVLEKEAIHQFSKNQEPNKFFDLCVRNNCFPDIWSLTEARNWLTPAFFPKRFDTAFFLCCLDQTPPVEIDLNEVSDFKWEMPFNYMDQHKAKKLTLPPPQQYEFTIMTAFPDLETLDEAAKNKLFCKDQCYLPVRYKLKDGVVVILPGDSFYEVGPEEGDILDYKDLTIADFRQKTEKLHRFELLAQGKPTFIKNHL